MAMNTKARHLEIYAAAVEVLENAGGVSVIDSLPQDRRLRELREMARCVTEMTDCHIDSAKRNVAKALRRARYGLTQENSWGGRRGGGRPRKNDYRQIEEE